MIRRVSKNCDLRDYIKSCPSGVVDDIYKIEYYIQGNNVVIECSFTKVGDTLDVVIPTSQLQLLPNGILMRRCFYKVVDTSYPDGYYNLEFEDNMNIWLGETDSEQPVIPEYVTEDELASELTSYATQSWVQSQDYLTASTLPSDIATEQFVTVKIGELRELTNESINALNSAIYNLSMMTRDSFSVIGYSLSQMWEEFATKSWVAESFATYSYVNSAVSEATNYFRAETSDIRYEMSSMTESISALNEVVASVSETCSALSEDISAIINDMATQDDISALQSGIDEIYSYLDDNSYVTQDWLSEEGYLRCSSLESYNDSYPLLNMSDSGLFIAGYYDVGGGASGPGGLLVTESGLVGLYSYDLEDQEGNFREFATQSWVQAQGYLTSNNIPSGLATQTWVSSNFLSSGALSGYATQSWVSGALSGYATQSWVYSKLEDKADVEAVEGLYTWVRINFLSSTALSGYATEQFVTSSLSSYATQSWVSSNFLSSSWVEDELSSYALTYNRNNDWIYESDKVYIGNGGLLFCDWVGDENGVSGVYLSSSTAGIYGIDSVTYEYAYDPFATQSWVQAQGYLTSNNIPSGLATQSWVSSNFLSSDALSGYATESWVQAQGYLSTVDMSDYVLKSYESDGKSLKFNTTIPGILIRNSVSEQLNISATLFSMHGSSYEVLITPNVIGVCDTDLSSPKVAGEIYDTTLSEAVLVVRDGSNNVRIGCNNIYTIYNGVGTTIPISDLATQSWVQSQGYITSTGLSGLATQSWVESQGYLTSVPSEYATKNYVDQAIGTAISGNVVEYDVNHPLIEEFGLNVDVLKRNEFDNGSNVITKGLVLAYEETIENGDVNSINTIEIRNGLLMSVNYSLDGLDYHEERDPFATESWVEAQGYITSETIPSDIATQSWVQAQGYITSSGISGLATQSWVEAQGYTTQTWVENQAYLTSASISVYVTESTIESMGFATQSWVQSQGYTSQQNLASYATKTWVAAQGYITSTGESGLATQSWVTSTISSYATQSWVSSIYFEKSKIWTGTQLEWDSLTYSQQAEYTIALITE